MNDISHFNGDDEPSAFRMMLIRAEGVVQHFLRKFAALRRRLKARLNLLDPARFDLYLGMANDSEVLLRGRALEDPPLSAPKPDDSTWTNILRSFRLLETDELPGLTLTVEVQDQVVETTTDQDGFFEVSVPLSTPLSAGWHDFSATASTKSGQTATRGAFMSPSRSARYAVVSDIDDTILQTHVRNKLKMVWVTLLGNALTRLSFDHAPHLYRTLHERGGSAPFFYVSRSAWNIHGLLEQFVEHQGFPRGPMILRNAGIFSPPPEAKAKKRDHIEKLLSFFEYPLVCIGDSGQRDADIYTQLSRKYPDRIWAILIRDLGGENSARVSDILSDHGQCPCLLFRDDKQALHWLEEQAFFNATEQLSTEAE